MAEVKLVTTNLRAPLHRKFDFLGDGEKETPIIMTFLADSRRPPPEPSEPEEEEPEEVEPEPVQIEEEELTSAQIYAKLVAEQGENMSVLDYAALGRLRAWDTCEEGYSVQDLMRLVRWLEIKLTPPPPEEPMWRRLLMEFSLLTRRTRVRIAVGVSFAFLMFLIFFACFTGWALEATKVAAVSSDGVLTIAGQHGPVMAGLGASVHFHGLLDVPSLRTEDLRTMEDVVLKHNGDFHFYRVAGVTQVMGGGVRIAAEDGTLIRVRGDDVTIAGPFAKEEVVDPAMLREPGTASAFRAMKALLSPQVS
mmetsp:Transcript_43512/g.135186  ORF Transcript_43512/g.135186 Transcript_43512/m.135186 type:complete len:307 (-) Transcript_43512:55-975(-)